jgi:hypothetical protein
VFIGHFSLALASKRVAPRPSLGWLFAACQFPDLLWPVLVLAGVERVRIVPGDTAFTPLAFDYYPWSHSLLMDVGWGARSASRRALGWASGTRWLTIAIETAMYVAGVWIYLRIYQRERHRDTRAGPTTTPHTNSYE